MAGYKGNPRPTLDEITERVYSVIQNQIPGVDARLQNTPLNAIANALIGTSYELYGFCDWAARQTNLIDCDDANLDKYGEIWKIQRKAASYATGTATFTGINGTVIPAGTIIQTTTNLQYITTANITVTSGTAVASVKALTFGLVGNLSAGVSLTVVQAIPNIDSTVTTVSITGGADEETDVAYRARIQARIAYPPHGGAWFDYVAWAKEVPGVTRSWCTSNEFGLGTVSVRFMMDDSYSNGIPLVGDINTVQAYVDNVKPVAAKVTVIAPAPVPVNITITNLTPNTPAAQASVLLELKDMFRSKAEPGVTIRNSWIWEAVTLSTGNNYHTITSPTVDFTVTAGQIAVLGTVTFV